MFTCGGWSSTASPGSTGVTDLLTGAERRRADGILRERDRQRYVLSRFALRGVLGAYCGVSASTVRLARDSNGRPYVTVPSGPRSVDFNLSHSGDLALIAVARGRRVGVDVERVRELAHAGLAARVFTTNEAEVVASLDPGDQLKAFFRYWTCKEAYLKARGVGLSGLPGPEVRFSDRGPRMLDPSCDQTWTVTELLPGCGYSAALVVRGGSASVSTFTWTPMPFA